MIELRLAPDVLAKIREQEPRFDEGAYLFVLESIEFLQARLPLRRHVSGPELARACRDHALDQYGLMAGTVLDHWGIRSTEDLGRIVFTLVAVGLLVTQPNDRESDFDNIFDFVEAFDQGYDWPGLRRQRRRPGGVLEEGV
ncbi:MAG: Minf_1886 family protein [Gemmatimonadales bacterium]